GQHVIRALGRRAGEARVEQCAAQQVAPGAVVTGQALVILPTQRLETHRDRLLERRWRTHGQKVMHLPDRVGRIGRCDDGADTPASDAERLRRPADRNGALPHTWKSSVQYILSFDIELLVDL